VAPDPRERAIEAWFSQQLGPTGPWVRLDAMRGSTAVFGLTTADGHDRVIKQFRSPRAFEQERRALAQWFGDGERVGGARTPRLIAAAPELATLILERLPGAAADQDDVDMHRAAGRFLAALHQLEVVDDDPLPLAEALAQRTSAWLRRVALEPEQARIVEQHGPRPELFRDARRVACHRDFAPRNWLWDGEDLAVIDFEHARPDLALVDLTKLHVGVWSRRPACAAAFFEGYGRPLCDRQREQLRALVVLHGVASLAWGQERGDAELILEGRTALALAARPLEL
jgi:Ser/Thr protein kinase RdoA (MazF antagonist)